MPFFTAVGSKTKAVTSKAKSPKAGKASTKAAAEGDEPLNTPPREDASRCAATILVLYNMTIHTYIHTFASIYEHCLSYSL